MVLSAGVSASGFGNVLSAAAPVLGSVVNGFANAVTAYKQYKYQRDLQKLQAELNYKYWKKQYKYQNANGYSQSRSGLERAGYNPMLAVTNGLSPQGASSSYSSLGQASQADLSGLVSNATDISRMQRENAQVDATIENLNADSSLKDEQKNTEVSKQGVNNAESALNMIHSNYLPAKYESEIKYNASATMRNVLEGQTAISNAESNRIQALSSDRLVRQQIQNLKKQGIVNENEAKTMEIQMKFLPWQQRAEIFQKLMFGIGAGVGAGVGAGSGVSAVMKNVNKVPVGFR